MPDNLPKTSWKIRRRTMFAALAFSMLVVGYVLFTGMETAAAETAVAMAFSTIIATVGSYVFGATWDDKR